jgi:hypothetical protein
MLGSAQMKTTETTETTNGHLFTRDQLLDLDWLRMEVETIIERDYGISPAGLKVLAKLNVNIKCPEGSGAIPKLKRQGFVTHETRPSKYYPNFFTNIPVITPKGFEALAVARSLGW